MGDTADVYSWMNDQPVLTDSSVFTAGTEAKLGFAEQRDCPERRDPFAS
jgi:hypothetical protein